MPTLWMGAFRFAGGFCLPRAYLVFMVHLWQSTEWTGSGAKVALQPLATPGMGVSVNLAVNSCGDRSSYT